MSLKMSDHGRKLLAQWEGFETQVYRDVKGLETIGVGHLLTAGEKSSRRLDINGELIDYSTGISEQQVYDLLGQDLQRFEAAVNDHVKVDLDQNQFDALVSFSFNVGVAAFKSSTLLQRLNDRDFDDVPNQLNRWNKAGGKVVQGLVNRRNNEIKLWSGDL